MQTKLALLLAGFLAGSAAAVAAPLTAAMAVHTTPDQTSPVITVLKAGTEPTVANEALGTSPAGWLPVTLPGPFEGYVHNRDVMKSLDLRIGAPVRLQPQPDAAVITEIDADDKAEITGLHGRWNQVKVEKTLTGYIHLGGAPGYLPPIATTPAGTTVPPVGSAAQTPSAQAPVAPAPVAPTAYGVAPAGQPAPVVGVGAAAGPSLPRLFQGKFVSTRSAFRPRRPYEWAVNDDAGSRYAYLDISKLLLTDQIENYVNHQVVVYGAAKAVPDTKDIVIEVESLQLK